MKYLAYNSLDNLYEEFDNIEEAREYLEDAFYQEGLYTDEMVNCKIYKLEETVDYDVVDNIENYTYHSEEDAPEDSDDYWPYDSESTEVWQHKFVKQDYLNFDNLKDISSKNIDPEFVDIVNQLPTDTL